MVSHGGFASELLASNEMVAGKLKKSAVLSLNPGDDPQVLGQQILTKVQQLDEGDGVLIVVDMVGGTPYNRAMALVRGMELNACVVAGMNMPMIMVLNLEREETTPLKTLAQMAETGGKDGIRSFTSFTPVAVPAADADDCEED